MLGCVVFCCCTLVRVLSASHPSAPLGQTHVLSLHTREELLENKNIHKKAKKEVQDKEKNLSLQADQVFAGKHVGVGCTLSDLDIKMTLYRTI